MRTWRREIGHRLRQEQPVSRYIESSTSPRHLSVALVTGHAVSEHAQHPNTPTAPKPWKEGYVVHNQKEKKPRVPWRVRLRLTSKFPTCVAWRPVVGRDVRDALAAWVSFRENGLVDA